MGGYYLGFDSSTQSMKAIIIDPESERMIADASVNFTSDLPQFKCVNGVLENPDPLIKHSDPMMWLAALDLVLGRLAVKKAPLSEVAAISGSGQQHGSVYLNSRFPEILRSLAPCKELTEQLAPALSRQSSPIWMDSSTSHECAEIAKAVGAGKLRELTGSPAVERFTGPQIRKFFKTQPNAYESTAHIHLVSSFMASVLCGASAPIDFGDGAGMNLLNLKKLSWDTGIAAATAPGLIDKLPKAVSGSTVAGPLHPYFAKYGLKPGTPVIAWSGDNPCSLVGVGACEPGVAVVSLGTSDTFFAAMRAPHVDPDGFGHVFGNPAGGFMSLICFKNGSLAREKVKDECGVDWSYFDKRAFADTPAGNNGNMMLPYYVPEITPLVLKAGVRLKGEPGFASGKGAKDQKIRAVVESQMLSMRLHSQWIGERFDRIRVTGGASQGQEICRTIANVFQATLEKISVSESAALGAAMRAASAVGNHTWKELAGAFAKTVSTIEPDRSLADVYDKALSAYARFEKESA